VVAVTYQVEVSRDGDAWVADVANLDGAHTYARDLGTLMRNVDEVIRLVADLDDAEQYGVQWVWNVDEVEREAIALGEEKRRLDALERKRAARATELAALLVERGVKVRDAAAMLGVSPGRISQLTGGTLRERTVVPTPGPGTEPVVATGLTGTSVVEYLKNFSMGQQRLIDDLASGALSKAVADSMGRLPGVVLRAQGSMSAFGDVHASDEL
jgi:hypothetical protein